MESDMMRADRLPSMCDGVAGLSIFDDLRFVPSAVWAQESFALCIETCEFFGAGEISKVITALTIFSFVIDDLTLTPGPSPWKSEGCNFHLPYGIVALKVGGVVVRVP